MYVKIINTNIKLELDTGGEISIINTDTGEKIERVKLNETPNIARGVLEKNYISRSSS